MASNDKGLEEIPEGMCSYIVCFIFFTANLWFISLYFAGEWGSLSSQQKKEIIATTHHRNVLRRIMLTRNFTSIGQIETNYDEVTDSFDSMDLKPELLRGM
ncbi:uncharacterized protein BO87DRAFT_375351 [Aspergillus neoniger CBS 115656]|uniref:Uncharacterized protein n=1 Tax=Aspergillus neoniger (strain CBS 115656) TaxID=1448310 RepID=A0A318YN94_ASPNB|nr:hypothetical protein BO87DRAFT_375351 [Aspergillus neoniger CBS 115656]PYH35734.1 hypothetical protein BO87DRAFT_375351 [Aspergillus neoniger CBS 115656]